MTVTFAVTLSRHHPPAVPRTWKLLLHGTILLLTSAALVQGDTFTVGVAQVRIEPTLEGNTAKMVRMIRQAGALGCELVVFPENALYWPDITDQRPRRDDLDRAMERLQQAARRSGLWVAFGVAYPWQREGEYQNHAVVFDAAGRRVLWYRKNHDVPPAIQIHHARCNFVLCSDRGYLEISDLPCLTQGSQVIIDISGGHGGDDGRPALRWIRYRPWALRTGAYVVVSNPVHDEPDFMGNRPWGGCSAVVRPDGSLQAWKLYEVDQLLVEKLDLAQASLAEAQRRANHPSLRPFWQAGKELLQTGRIAAATDLEPLQSPRQSLRVALAQIRCACRLEENTQAICQAIAQAAARRADVVVFPELALTGARASDILAATPDQLDAAIGRVCQAARAHRLYVVVGTPAWTAGRRHNAAVVAGPDGTIITCYRQIACDRADLFVPGTDPGSMWFSIRGVPAVVTIGSDARWVELADLAAARGAYVHFHLAYAHADTPDQAQLQKQTHLVFLSYARHGAVVNAADPSGLQHPSLPADGGSLLVSRVGGHNRPAPDGVQYYLPYQTSILQSAGREPQMLLATWSCAGSNGTDLVRGWRHRQRRSRGRPGWYDWILLGTRRISPAVSQLDARSPDVPGLDHPRN